MSESPPMYWVRFFWIWPSTSKGNSAGHGKYEVNHFHICGRELLTKQLLKKDTHQVSNSNRSNVLICLVTPSIRTNLLHIRNLKQFKSWQQQQQVDSVDTSPIKPWRMKMYQRCPACLFQLDCCLVPSFHRKGQLVKNFLRQAIEMGVSENNGIPKSSILIGFSLIFTIHFGGFPLIFGSTPKEGFFDFHVPLTQFTQKQIGQKIDKNQV